MEFASLYKAFQFLDQNPILRLSKACRPALGIGGEEGVFPRMWNELTESATTHFDMVIDMINGERMDGWMVETGKLNGEKEKLNGETEKLNGETEKLNEETEKLNGEMEKLNGEKEKLGKESVEQNVETRKQSDKTWRSINETSELLLQSMRNRLKATREANWRWIEFL